MRYFGTHKSFASFSSGHERSLLIRRCLWAALFLVLPLAVTLSPKVVLAEDMILSGTIVDPQDMPVSNADIGVYWDFLSDRLTPMNWAFSDEDGTFELSTQSFRNEGVVCAFSDDRKLGCARWLKISELQNPATLKLSRVVNVCINVKCSELNTRVHRGLIEFELINPDTPPWPDDLSLDSIQTWIKTLPEGTVAASSFAVPSIHSDKIRVPLPPGRYLIRVNSMHMEDHYVPLIIDETQPDDIDVNVDMSLSPLARLLAKPAPPWNISDSRGIEKDARPEDFRGKWLLVEFWGYWCGPCIAHSLPKLIDFHEQNPELADQLQIITVHHEGVESITELEEKLAKIRTTHWKDRDLPFPVIIDATSKTVDAYGIVGFPTAVLVDPSGNVTTFNGLNELKSIVAGRIKHSTKPIEELYAPDEERDDPDSPRAINHVKIRPTYRNTAHKEAVTELQVDVQSSRIFSTGWGMALIEEDARNGEMKPAVALHESITFSSESPQLFFDADRNRIVTTRATRGARFYDGPLAVDVRNAETMELVPTAIPAVPQNAKIALVDRSLLTASWDAAVRQSMINVTSFETGEVAGSWSSPQQISCWAVSPRSDIVVCGGIAVSTASDNAIESPRKNLFAMDLLTGKQLWFVEYPDSHVHRIRDVAFSPDGKLFVASNWNDDIEVRSAETGAVVRTLRMHNHSATAAAFSPDGKRLVTSGSNISPAVVWNLETGEYTASLIGHRFGRIYRAMFLSDTRLVTVGGETIGEVCVWNLPPR